MRSARGAAASACRACAARRDSAGGASSTDGSSGRASRPARSTRARCMSSAQAMRSGQRTVESEAIKRERESERLGYRALGLGAALGAAKEQE